MKAWKNLEFGKDGVRVNDPKHLAWRSRECSRLKTEWARDTSRLLPQGLQPMVYHPNVVVQEITRSKLMPSPEGGHMYFVVDYVVDLDGRLRVGFSHTRLSEMTDAAGVKWVGMPALAAGQISYGGGAIQEVDNWSGHYRPHLQDQGRIQAAFASAGLGRLLERSFSTLYVEQHGGGPHGELVSISKLI